MLTVIGLKGTKIQKVGEKIMERKFSCPYCVVTGKTPDTKGHLYVNKEKGVYYCQRCGVKGKLKRDCDTLQLKTMPSIPSNKFDNVTFVNLVSALHISKNAQDVMDYCLKRLPYDSIIPDIWWSEDIPRRAFFVIWDENKPVVWQGRSIDKDIKPKYLTWGKKSEYIYNYENVNEEWAVLCEGPFSALSCPNGLALFGNHLSVQQGILLASKFQKLYLAVEKGAEREWEEIENSLQKFVKCVKLKMGEKDSNDYGYEKMKEIIYEADKDNIPMP